MALEGFGGSSGSVRAALLGMSRPALRILVRVVKLLPRAERTLIGTDDINKEATSAHSCLPAFRSLARNVLQSPCG